MQKIFIFFAVLLSSHAFSQTKFSEKKGGHIFFVSVPDYMLKTLSLNDVATIQYQNTNKHAYMIVIMDSKEELEMSDIKFENLKEYHDSTIKSLKPEGNSPVESAPKEFQQNGISFYQSELSVKIKDENSVLAITYLVTYAESKTHYYQILCWSITDEYKNLAPDFIKIASSIKE